MGEGRQLVSCCICWHIYGTSINHIISGHSFPLRHPKFHDSRPVLSLGRPLVKLQAEPGGAVLWNRKLTFSNVAPVLGIRNAKLAADLLALCQKSHV